MALLDQPGCLAKSQPCGKKVAKSALEFHTLEAGLEARHLDEVRSSARQRLEEVCGPLAHHRQGIRSAEACARAGPSEQDELNVSLIRHNGHDRNRRLTSAWPEAEPDSSVEVFVETGYCGRALSSCTTRDSARIQSLAPGSTHIASLSKSSWAARRLWLKSRSW